MGWTQTSTMPLPFAVASDDGLDALMARERVALTPELKARLSEMTADERIVYAEQLGLAVESEKPLLDAIESTQGRLFSTPINAHDYFSESAVGADTFMGRDGRFQQALGKTGRALGVAAMIGGVFLPVAGTVFGASDAYAAEPTMAAEQVVVPVIGRGGGYNGSLWRSELFLVNPSLTEDGHGRIVFFNTANGDDVTNPSTPVTVPARGNLVLVDPAGQAGLDGNWAVKYIPEADTPQIDVKARTWNQQNVAASNPALTELSQYVDGVKQSQLLSAGDLATFVLPDSGLQDNGQPRFRFNIHAYGEATVAGEAPTMMVDLFDHHGNYVDTLTLTLPDHGRAQWTNFVPTVFERDQAPYDVLRFTVTKGKVLMIGTPVQNNTDVTGLDDGGVQVPTIDRLVQSGTYTVAPGTVEANDPVVEHLSVTSTPGTKVDGCALYGGWEHNVAGNGTNTLTFDDTHYPTVAGDYTIRAVCGVSTTDGGFLGARTIQAGTLHVDAEQNHNVPISDTVRAHMTANLTPITQLLAKGYVIDPQDPTRAYLISQGDWMTSLTQRLDGDTANNEISAVTMYVSPRAIVLSPWFNSTGAVLTVNGFDKQDERTLYTLMTGDDSW